MPELPEVETIKRVIEPQIQSLMIDKVNVKRPEVVAYPAADEFCGLLTGQTISHMTRRGKFLVIHLNSNDRIILHLRMTGCLLLTPADCPEEKHTHITFSLNNGKELRFSDTRRFGRFWLMKKDEADTYSGTRKLGAEPLDKQLTAGYLQARLGKRKKAVKECLLVLLLTHIHAVFCCGLAMSLRTTQLLKTFLKQGCQKKRSFTGGIIGCFWSIVFLSVKKAQSVINAD